MHSKIIVSKNKVECSIAFQNTINLFGLLGIVTGPGKISTLKTLNSSSATFYFF